MKHELSIIPKALAASVPNLYNSRNIIYVYGLCKGVALRCFTIRIKS